MLYAPKLWRDTNREEDDDAQCFGIQIAISNQDIDMFDFLWGQKQIWLNAHVSYILPHILRHWPVMTQHFLMSQQSKDLFINIDLPAKSVWIRQVTTRCADAEEEILN